MINAKIPQHERAIVPLLVCGPQIVWIVGWRVDARYAVGEGTDEGVVVRFSGRQPSDDERLAGRLPRANR
jgi:hypothetical protein